MQQTIIYITHAPPSVTGNGGVHRSYQVFHELERLVGHDRILLLTADFLASLMHQKQEVETNGSGRSGTSFRRWLAFRSGTAVRFAKNPYRLFHRTSFAIGLHPLIVEYYTRQIRNLSGAVCVFDHAQFSELIAINRAHGIPNVSCTQNLDALGDDFDSISSSLAAFNNNHVGTRERLGVYATMTDFANEVQSLAQCDARLFISKLEAGLMSGLGLSCHYYPYLPVGDLRQRQMEIRKNRANSKREQRLFLLVGSASYGPIRKSCEWFIQNARKHGLPSDVRVIVIGAGTNTLISEEEAIPGVEAKGWMEQKELDELLVRAQAVLVPQQFGFGAPTRLSELSCAGIPVIGCEHPTYAIDSPPGFRVTDGTWETWYRTIEQMSRKEIEVPEAEYVSWEAAQPKPLQQVVSSLLS